jgi:hypothetical protein
VPDVPSALLAQILGCEWGRGIRLPDDAAPCPERATVVVVLHGAGEPRPFRVCAAHFATVQTQTDPHRPIGE